MSFVKAIIKGCRSASIRKKPWVTPFAEDVVGERNKGDTIEVDFDQSCYDWKGRKFYKTRIPDGWVYDGVISTDRGD